MTPNNSDNQIKEGDIHPIRGWIAELKNCKFCTKTFYGYYLNRYCEDCTKGKRRRTLTCHKTLTCKNCNKGFVNDVTAKTWSRKYCEKCRDRKVRKSEPRRCVQCTNPFTPCEGRPNAKLCSRVCQGLWVNANGLGPKHNDDELWELLVESTEKLGKPQSAEAVLKKAGVTHKTLIARGWKINDIYTAAKVDFTSEFASRFEEVVYKVLVDIFGETRVEKQKSFDDLRSQKNAKLHFDFWIPCISMAVESDGVQHYTEHSFFDSTFENDQVKNDYCRVKKYKILRIKYARDISTQKLKDEISTFCKSLDPSKTIDPNSSV